MTRQDVPADRAQNAMTAAALRAYGLSKSFGIAADLSAFDDTDFATGATSYVNATGYYVLDRAASQEADGVLYVAARTGVGRWVLQLQWRDLPGDIAVGVTDITAPTLEAYRDTGVPNYFFRRDQPTQLTFRYQMQHDWQPKTDVHPHFHGIPMAADGGDVAVALLWAWENVGSVFPALDGWTTAARARTVTGAEQYKHTIFSLGAITPAASLRVSSILQLQITVDCDHWTYNGDKDHGTAAANVALLSADVHYQAPVTREGTFEEFPGA